MNYNEALEGMGTTNNAAKRGVMVGYVWKFTTAKNGLAALSTAEVEAGGYRLALVQRDGDQYIYTYDSTTKKFTYNGYVAHGTDNALGTGDVAQATTLPFDADLMTHIGIGSDWTLGTQADYDAVRNPSGSSEW